MKRIKSEDLSLHHYVKNYILRDFVEAETVPLQYKPEESSTTSYVYGAVSSTIPSPASRGRGWCYLDNAFDTTEQQNSVIVYDAYNAVISGSNYIIDYIDGRVIFGNQSIIPASVYYKWHYIAVVDEWPITEIPDPPVVAIDIASFSKEGFQLGGGKRVPRMVYFHIFANDSAERDDITETLYDGVYLKCCPNQEFNNGTVIDWNGTFNIDYTYTTYSGSSELKFDNVVARSIVLPLLAIPDRDLSQLSDVNKYRSRVNFEMAHWDEGF